MPAEDLPGNKPRARRRWPRVLGLVAAGFIGVAALSAWWIKSNLYASPFRPTTLDGKEQQVLSAKLDRLQRSMESASKPPRAGPAEPKREGHLAPEPYSEDAARRELRITEKEVNALIARDEAIARRVAIALSRDLVSVKVVMPVDEDIPVLGGKTLRLNCGITLRQVAGRPVVALRGVSLGGVPIPAAWFGNLKNVDLVREFGGQGGFWELFSKGVEDLQVLDGSLFVKLKE